MKIIGLTYDGAHTELVVKGDSALLVNEKPFFLPESAEKMAMQPCLVLRVCKLGKHIAERFAERYYDAWTIGADIWATKLIPTTILSGNQAATMHSLDGSMVVGEMQEKEAEMTGVLTISNEADSQDEQCIPLSKDMLICSPDTAITEISRYMTIRQGDLIYIDLKQTPVPLEAEHRLHAYIQDKQTLFCKIK